jgi:hypothetical protein
MCGDIPHGRIPLLNPRYFFDEPFLQGVKDVLDNLDIRTPLVCCNPLLLLQERF